MYAARNWCVDLPGRLTRRKFIDWKRVGESNFARCLTTLDLTALGVGGTLGAGAYVITGEVARNDAGPAVVLSFLIAAVASILAGICYAEFGARVPKTGSAYTFTYVTVGEGLAFVIGWNLLLEYVIGAASVARTFSGYFDFVVGDKIKPWFNETLPMNIPTLAPYADPMALAIVLLVTVILAIGVKESATVSKVFTVMNLLVLAFIICAGGFKDDPKNWHLPAPNVTVCGKDGKSSCGEGGFAPFGFAGVVKGAATAFYAYVGFDTIATTGEEVKKPQRAIPISIILSLFIVAAVYCALAITVTMMEPYYLLDTEAPLAKIFENYYFDWAKYLIAAGAICALSTSILGAMFPMPRVVFAMARDGLIFRFLGKISKRFRTPVWATAVSGVLAGIMAFLFNVDALVNMMSIGTLMAYTLVCTSVLVLRYDLADEDYAVLGLCPPLDYACSKIKLDSSSITELKLLNQIAAKLDERGPPQWTPPVGVSAMLKEIYLPSVFTPTPFSAKVVKILTAALIVEITLFSAILTFCSESIYYHHAAGPIAAFAFCLLSIVASVAIIGLQPMSCKSLSFRVPFVPVFPVIAVFFTIYLMIQLDSWTWGRLCVWMSLGFVIYFFYGISHSSEELGIREDDVSVVDCNGGVESCNNNANNSNGFAEHQFLTARTELENALEDVPLTPFMDDANASPVNGDSLNKRNSSFK